MDLENVSCPICLRKFDNLQALNAHLDVEHGFNDNEDSLGSNDSRLVNGKQKKAKTVDSSAQSEKKPLGKIQKREELLSHMWKDFE